MVLKYPRTTQPLHCLLTPLCPPLSVTADAEISQEYNISFIKEGSRLLLDKILTGKYKMLSF